MDEREHNKRLIRDLLAAADAGDLDRVAGFYAPGYVNADARGHRRPDGATDRDAALHALREFARGFPDARHEIHDLLAEGDRVVARLSAEGTHTGEFFGHAATGRRVRNDAIVIYRIEDGRIAERWSRERRSTLEQLADPAPGAG